MQLMKKLEHLGAAERFALADLEQLSYELMYAEEEVKRVQSVPRVIGQFLEAVDQHHAIVQSTTGRLPSLSVCIYHPHVSDNILGVKYFSKVLSILDREMMRPGCSVCLHKFSSAVIDVLPPEMDSTIQMLRADQKPKVSYADIGGLEEQKQEIREAVEMPLNQAKLYEKVCASVVAAYSLSFWSHYPLILDRNRAAARSSALRTARVWEDDGGESGGAPH